MNVKPHVSLVMCTRNRAASLPQCLQALSRLRADIPYELVLVDNGSSDGTAKILGEFANQHKTQVVFVSEPCAGVSRARNAGINAATGDLIVFTDDDCYPAEDFIEAVTQCFQDAGVGFVGGRILLFDPADLPITIQPLNQAVALSAGTYMQPGLIHGANFAFRREVLDRIGGFDPQLGAGTRLMGAEDADILQRALSAGFRGLYSPAPLVLHHHRRQIAEDERRILRAYSISRGAYFLKGLMCRETRHLYYWPVFRRFSGHIAHCRLRTLLHECIGAAAYWRLRRQAQLGHENSAI